MAVSPQLKELILSAAAQFRWLNRSRTLSGADKKQLKVFFLEHLVAPHMDHLTHQNLNGRKVAVHAPREHTIGQQMLTAKEVESWLKIDRQTLYLYANQRLIPHIRVSRTVRFPVQELQKWIARCTYLPPEIRPGRRSVPRRIAGRWRTRDKARRTH